MHAISSSWRSKPAGAKETRVFGLADWLIDRYQEQWTLGMATAWQMLRRYNIGVTRLGAVVLAAYLGAVSVIAYGAYHHPMSLTTLAILLPMLVASAEVGDISWNDVALEWQLTALPNLEALELSLARARARAERPPQEPPPGRARA